MGADSFRLYLADNGNPDALNLYIGHDLMDNGEPKMQKIKCDSHSIPTYVARTREPVRISKDDQDPRFPESFIDVDVCIYKTLNFASFFFLFLFPVIISGSSGH